MAVTVSRTQAILLGVLALALLIIGGVLGRSCSHDPVAPPTTVVTGIDAGPGEEVIAGTLDGAVQAGQVHIEQIEHKFDSDIAAFDDTQRAEYARLRGGDDLDAAAAYLSDWNRQRRAMKEDAGP
jgi:hypothetical protein